MELSSSDIKRLEEAGYDREEFTATGKDGVIRLRNIGGRCYFYNYDDQRCRVYDDRPLGCYLYPVVYSDDEGIVLDELCPMGETISKFELRKKGRILIKLLKTLDNESEREVA
jgi:Fe-S-cluster containining protein